MAHRKGPRPRNEGEKWTNDQIKTLRAFAQGNTPTRLIADALGRSVDAVYKKASEEGFPYAD